MPTQHLSNVGLDFVLAVADLDPLLILVVADLAHRVVVVHLDRALMVHCAQLAASFCYEQLLHLQKRLVESG